MNEENIEKFLNLPGVVGVALIHGKHNPFFHPQFPKLEFQQKQTLNKSLMDFMAQAPEEFDLLEFRAMDYYAYAYKLSTEVFLLALSTNDSAAIKLLAGKKLKATLQKNLENTFTIFRAPTFNKTLHGTNTGSNSATATSSQDKPSEELGEIVTVEALLKIINNISRVGSNYMGKKIISNYWESTRPKQEWLEKFEINNLGEIIFSGKESDFVTVAQHQLLKDWVAAFIKQCSMIMQDLPGMIEEKCLDERKKRLIMSSVNR